MDSFYSAFSFVGVGAAYGIGGQEVLKVMVGWSVAGSFDCARHGAPDFAPDDRLMRAHLKRCCCLRWGTRRVGVGLRGELV